jgi:hypothetical protein
MVIALLEIWLQKKLTRHHINVVANVRVSETTLMRFLGDTEGKN